VKIKFLETYYYLIKLTMFSVINLRTFFYRSDIKKQSGAVTDTEEPPQSYFDSCGRRSFVSCRFRISFIWQLPFLAQQDGYMAFGRRTLKVRPDRLGRITFNGGNAMGPGL